MNFNILILVITFCCGKSFGIIYRLNESEYERLPRLFELENYERCMEAPGGVYCVANLELYTDRSSDLYTLIQEYSEFTLKHYNYSRIDRGVCVTQTCESHARRAGLDINGELGALLEGCLNETIRNKYGLMARVYNMNCVKESDKDQINLDYFDYTFLGIFIILLVLCLVGSCCEIASNGRNNEQYCKIGLSGKDLLLCFSVPQNYKSLTERGERDPRLNVFKSVHAFRTILTFCTVYTHTCFIMATGFSADPHSFEKAYESLAVRMSFSGTNIVQVYFFVSAMLLAYFMQVFAETNAVSWKLAPRIIFLRWLRLTPPAATLVAFSASWMRRLGSGPLWRPYIIDGSAAQCRRYFWAHVLYFNNYIPEDNLCAIHTWYIAADMQLFMVGVVVHFALRGRSRRRRLTALAVLLLLAMAGPALHVWWQDLDAFVLQTPELYRTLDHANLRKLHILGHNNMSCFIVGLAAGYLVYYLQQNKVEYPNFKIGNFICWCVIPMYILLLYCGSLFYYDGERPSLAIRMLFAGTNRVIVGILAALWMVGVTLKYNGMSEVVMEWRGWVLPSRLSYCVYLLHNIFVELGLGLKTQLVPVSFFNTFLLSVGIFLVTFALAVPFHLLVEAPAVRLIKLTANGKMEKKLN